MRTHCVFGVAIVAALTGSGAPHAQTPAPNQRVWTGTWEQHDSWEGSNRFGRSQAQISFVYVQGQDEFGTPRWESRRLTWSALWEESIFNYLALGLVGEADQRGFIKNRYPTDSVTSCTGGGTLELGPAVAGSGDDLTPEQKAQLQADCVTTYQPRDSAVPTPPPTLSRRDALPAPGMPNEEELTGCAYEKTWLMGTRGAGSFSVSVSAPVTAVMEVDPDPKGTYGRFVPVPGETLTFVASVPAGTARFRFELDPEATSHFPGYATNANVDDEMFFLVHDLAHLQDQYANHGPDFLFDASRFDPQAWSRVEPLVVETSKPQGAAVVVVTAMDYGAVGRLRAFVRSEECGDWQPVPVLFGLETRESVAIPMDEDNDLMADALEEYKGDPGRDEDAEPKGNGFAGDGFTAFEEYRGFMAGAACRYYDDPRRVLWHSRTRPDHKDLLVAINANAHGLEPGLRLFEYATGLHLLVLCDQHMIDGWSFGVRHPSFTNTPESRVVNFTLQQQGLRFWNGRQISQEPQRGVVIMTYRPGCFEQDCGKQYGEAEPVDDRLIGPPKLTKTVRISQYLNEAETAVTVVHEMGHTVGIPHHSDDVGANWELLVGRLNVNGLTSPYQRQGGNYPLSAPPMDAVGGLLVDPGPTCGAQSADARYENGRFVGCYTLRIIRRGQQNSGEFHCPMRYRFGEQSRYEPPGTTSGYLGTLAVDKNAGDPPVTVDHWTGALLPYEMSRESITDFRSFCRNPRGTLINEGDNQRNHAGDTGRQKSCLEFLVVNDRAAARVP